MPYSVGPYKWGEPTYGEPSGAIAWSQDFIDDLNLGIGASEGSITAALNEAFEAWENVAAIDFQMVSSGGDVMLNAVSLDDGVAGQASISYGGGSGVSEIFSAEIDFNIDLTWSPHGSDGTGSDGTNFYAVALHEIGHVLGLNHVDGPNEIMNPVITADDLGAGDIAGAQHIYGTDAGDTPVGNPGSGVSSGGSSEGGGGGAAIGLLAGLLALIIGLFTGGGGAAVALAAGRVPDDGDDETGSHFDFSLLPGIPVVELARQHEHDDDDDDEAMDWLI